MARGTCGVTVQSCNMASYPKDVRERLTFWDGKENCLSPLTDKEKDSVLLLSAHSSNRSLPSGVSLLLVPNIYIVINFDVARINEELSNRCYITIV